MNSMSMHLEGPWLSTTGKRKGKPKFRNAEEARKARDLEQSWKELQKKWGLEAEDRKRKQAMSAPTWSTPNTVYRRDTGPKIPSLNGGADMSPAIKAAPKVYTGTKIKGIGTMHKSNAVPIFTDDEARDIANMRR
jgi:hypothetical protein